MVNVGKIVPDGIAFVDENWSVDSNVEFKRLFRIGKDEDAPAAMKKAQCLRPVGGVINLYQEVQEHLQNGGSPS